MSSERDSNSENYFTDRMKKEDQLSKQMSHINQITNDIWEGRFHGRLLMLKIQVFYLKIFDNNSNSEEIGVFSSNMI